MCIHSLSTFHLIQQIPLHWMSSSLERTICKTDSQSRKLVWCTVVSLHTFWCNKYMERSYNSETLHEWFYWLNQEKNKIWSKSATPFSHRPYYKMHTIIRKFVKAIIIFKYLQSFSKIGHAHIKCYKMYIIILKLTKICQSSFHNYL